MNKRQTEKLTRSIAARLRDARAAADLTQEALAARCGVQAGVISRIEHGRTIPTIPTLAALAEGLGCNVADLIDPGRPVPTPAVSDDERAALTQRRALAPAARAHLDGLVRELLGHTDGRRGPR